MEEQIGLFDLDDSLANHHAAIVRDLEKLAAPNDPPIGNEWEADKIPHMKARMDVIRNQPDWWFNLEPIPAWIVVFDIARTMGFDCQVLTKGPKLKYNAWGEKVRWCHKHLGTDHLIGIMMSKNQVYGKFLYDDYPEYLTKWLKSHPRGLGIMLVNKYNEQFEHPRVVKYYPGPKNNLEEVVRCLRIVKERKKGEPLNLS